ncbi:head-tail connector protein [Bacillus mycoides]|uniref:head-tail connector protein n=1 Tax=Bacillus mycoides TaxID=1405 RepID=UPI002113223B|nr:head-tail connector protein [Bacillus mycoides]MCQ6531146.1 head-tail connector protein [Bacillus mycoides]
MKDMLLQDVKSRLRITWDDEDAQLIKTIERGKAYLQNLCGTSFSFEQEDQVKQLLIERCRYEYNNALEDFEKNFRGELQRFIIDAALKERSKNETIQRNIS